MNESLRQHYVKEEDFLKEFSKAACKAAEVLGGAWRSDPACDDWTRQRRHETLNAGQLDELVFESAAVYDDANRDLSSLYIILRSSKRVVSVQVRNKGGALVAEKVLDSPW